MLAGYPLWPVIRVFPSHALGIVFAYVTLLQVSTLLAAFVLVRHACGSRWAVLGTFVVLPATLVQGHRGARARSVAGYWEVFPFRLLVPLVVGAVLAAGVDRWRRWSAFVVLGCFWSASARSTIPSSGCRRSVPPRSSFSRPTDHGGTGLIRVMLSSLRRARVPSWRTASRC